METLHACHFRLHDVNVNKPSLRCDINLEKSRVLIDMALQIRLQETQLFESVINDRCLNTGTTLKHGSL